MTISRAEFRWPLRVYYEDTDAAGIVYHANFIKFMERARTEWLRALGFEQNLIAREHGIAFVVRRATLDFVRPARFNDSLIATCAVARCGWASVDFKQQVLDQQGALLCGGEIRVGSVNFHRMAPVRMPPAIYLGISNAR
ncbi:MAG: tol-pal system-associated acyl-CoA thioesterase [Gammaproteobacteria bacterium]|nr:tol-pal system-associated acyl-CoA thioesterase [Gammaproteobacteria bacterium]